MTEIVSNNEDNFDSSILEAEIKLQNTIKKKQDLIIKYKDIYNNILQKIDEHVKVLKDINNIVLKNKDQDEINKSKINKYNQLNENLQEIRSELKYLSDEYSDKQQVASNMKKLLKDI